jgi:hypothetical protein
MRTVLRRTLLLATAAALGAHRAKAAPGNVVAGAIRWDAWYQPRDNSVFAQSSLGWKQYQDRAPAHCVATADEQLTCVGTQAVMDAEIRVAHKAGLAYWAFVWYAPESSFRAAWNLYQSSESRHLVNWCGIVSLDRLGSVPFASGAWRAHVEEWAGYMQQPHYQKISVGGASRPVLFLLWQPRALQTHFADSVDNVRAALAYLDDLVVAAGLGRPYVVILDGVAGGAIRQACGADAISNYTSGFRSELDGPYADLDRQTRAYWAALAATGQPTVPIAMVGWDVRPRRAHPSRLLLIYSWDECDEGGGLIPTRGDPAGRYLSALSGILPGN